MNLMKNKITRSFILLTLILGFLAFVFILSYPSIAYLKNYSDQKEKATNDKIAILQKQISALNEDLGKVTGENSQFALSLKEVQQRQSIREKSQEEILTDAVAKVTLSVVSIVISKDMPLLDVTYENPFGDDPFYRNFEIQVPVYKQKGVQRQKIGAGSGIIVSSDGYILTNKHVASDDSASYAVLLQNGTQKEAKIVFRDDKKDISLLKIDGVQFNPVILGDSSTLRQGQTVAAIGNALGEYSNSVSVGIVSGLGRTIEASSGTQVSQLDNVIQTDAAINPGNSGGPLIDLKGEVVGVNVATVYGSSNISFSIPINTVRDSIKSYIKQ